MDHMGVAKLSELSIARGFRAIRAGYEGESGHGSKFSRKKYGSDNDTVMIHLTRHFEMNLFLRYLQVPDDFGKNKLRNREI